MVTWLQELRVTQCCCIINAMQDSQLKWFILLALSHSSEHCKKYVSVAYTLSLKKYSKSYTLSEVILFLGFKSSITPSQKHKLEAQNFQISQATHRLNTMKKGLTEVITSHREIREDFSKYEQVLPFRERDFKLFTELC